MSYDINYKRLLIGLSLSAVVIAAAAVWIPGTSQADNSQTKKVEKKAAVSRPALTVRTAMLREENWSRSLAANGSIVPWQEAVISAQVKGLRIAEVKVNIGDFVKRGDVLVTLDNFAGLGNMGASQGRILAPDDGVISAANANAGSMAQPGVELFRLIRKGRLEWRAELTADELMMLRKGMRAVISISESRSGKGSVRAISPSVDPKTRYGYAYVSLRNSKGIIAGAFKRGEFDISGGTRKLFSLPQSAVMRRGAEAYVMVVNSGNRVHERAVKTGQRKGNRIEIKSGLQEQEAVVQTGGPFLTEGDVVQLVKGS